MEKKRVRRQESRPRWTTQPSWSPVCAGASLGKARGLGGYKAVGLGSLRDLQRESLLEKFSFFSVCTSLSLEEMAETALREGERHGGVLVVLVSAKDEDELCSGALNPLPAPCLILWHPPLRGGPSPQHGASPQPHNLMHLLVLPASLISVN